MIVIDRERWREGDFVTIVFCDRGSGKWGDVWSCEWAWGAGVLHRGSVVVKLHFFWIASSSLSLVSKWVGCDFFWVWLLEEDCCWKLKVGNFFWVSSKVGSSRLWGLILWFDFKEEEAEEAASHFPQSSILFFLFFFLLFDLGLGGNEWSCACGGCCRRRKLVAGMG